jgi:hypothetical protein
MGYTIHHDVQQLDKLRLTAITQSRFTVSFVFREAPQRKTTKQAVSQLSVRHIGFFDRRSTGATVVD